VTVVAVELVSGSEALRAAVVNFEGSRHLGDGQGRASVVGAVTIGAGRPIALGVIAMTADPRLSESVDTVRPAIGRNRHTGVTDTAFSDLGDISRPLAVDACTEN
jgi:hypothetical protein